MIGCVSAERPNYWTCNVGSGRVGECAVRNVRFVATADGKLVTVRRIFYSRIFFFSWRYNPHWGLYFTAL